MTNFNCYPDDATTTLLKSDLLGQWIEVEWLQKRENHITVRTGEACVNEEVHRRYPLDLDLPGGYRFRTYEAFANPVAPRIAHRSFEDNDISRMTGAFIFRFEHPSYQKTVEVLVLCSDVTEDGRAICFACMPRTFVQTWYGFVNKCHRIERELRPSQQVVIIGGRSYSFTPTVDWDDIILPDGLKTDILGDVRSFFEKGVGVYQKLNLKPFRKLLLAGVPGTGKTMICSALAKWAIANEYLAIYISSADREGSTFGKIQHALDVAARSNRAAIVILEELDAYLHEEEKALVLNVLDGSESAINKRGTLLVATTNYPEAIDERVLKRPGRLDRIFIIPEMQREEDAEKMLRLYLDTMWQDEHSRVARKLVGYPGAFVREVAIYALTQVAYDDLTELPLEMLEGAYTRLRAQLDQRDEFLIKQSTNGHAG